MGAHAMRAELVFVGTELLLGEILNTNAQYLSQMLARHGIDVFFQTTVGDNMARLTATLQQAVSRADVVITTGGLGPTLDDLTREAVSAVLERPLREDPRLISFLEDYFAQRGIAMTDNNRRQAQVPEGGEPLDNPVGTAPGLWLDTGDVVVVCLPGPPRELIPIFEGQVLPRLGARRGDEPGEATVRLHSRVLKVVGLPEASVEDRLVDLLTGQSDPTMALYARRGEIHIRLATKAATAQEAESRFAPVEKEMAQRLGHHLFGADDDLLEAVVGRDLARRGLTLAVAESCTGGLVGHRITNVPGSSAYFLLGLTTYSNQAKEDLLAVPAAVLAEHGAVSAETAVAMAAGARRRAGSHVAVAITGIAGPGGGTPDKPVGTVYLAAAGGPEPLVRRLAQRGTREDIKERSATNALALLREYILIHWG